MADPASNATDARRVMALVVAAGRGIRAGGGLPKQYRTIGDRMVLERTVTALLQHPRIDGVRVVIHPDDRSLYDAAVAGLDLAAPVAGGATRQESVRAGLEALASTEPRPDIVLIHDAARCFVPAALVDRVLDAVDDGHGAIPALPVSDTLKRVADGRVVTTMPRDDLRRAQTPQGFPFPAILAAHRAAAARTDLTDDAAVAEGAGLPVRCVAGAEENVKLTTAADFARAQGRIAGAPAVDVRTGFGFDVHRFEPGDYVWLCGVQIPHEAGLSGHSDADAGLHALTDALLGCLAAGDIGDHFPPSEARWRDAPSHLFLAHAARLLRDRGGVILHCDLTLICEAPRIGPHRAAMRARIADLLGIALDRVSVKATTTERLGFAGRGEGIAAQAVATVRLPGELP
ncbi:MAG: bifunctional 2-C-methyl-D-erythritol 4-phosphate cytidylyltransferase/2-C-methyl-D-erythritol 2,4-cyclodiphosphate synthase [Alphaproteobacteria bacterium]|nr:MAG: bifunctional 2-C-methyl-D-erythritol 4-phosphate cytidylyltransferase/2-C-methyl-D-erythritol 2,4-cyclodiphosphate synthase [Alphaproteobacteria bacterium]